MFANDTNLSCTGRTSADIEYKINKDLNNIRKWIISNKLTLNLKKTDFIIIGSKPRLDAISETSKILYGDYQLIYTTPIETQLVQILLKDNTPFVE